LSSEGTQFDWGDAMTSDLAESYDPLGAHLADPYPFYARARHHEPVFYSWPPAIRRSLTTSPPTARPTAASGRPTPAT
jgi:hypothetical protein